MMLKLHGYLAFILVFFGSVRCDLARVPNVEEGEKPDCSCAYHRRGCVVSVAAPKGFKCRCSYRGLWTCSGVAYPCIGEERCPGNLADYCACKLGGGNCEGYQNPHDRCKDLGIHGDIVVGKASCDCDYYSGGCIISKAAPFGWKCTCVRKWYWSWGCDGRAQQCRANQICLENDFSYCGCRNGGGDCGGYPDKPYCPSRYLTQTCDCNKASDWNNGFYTINRVDYNTNNITVHSFRPKILTKKTIRNKSGETQSISFSHTKRVSQTSSFFRTSGIEIGIGMKFMAVTPLAFKGGVTGSISHTWGESETNETTLQEDFKCDGAAHKYTTCSVFMAEDKVSVPYVMQIEHKIIPNCHCESYGVWAGVLHNLKLVSNEVGDCSSDECGPKSFTNY